MENPAQEVRALLASIVGSEVVGDIEDEQMLFDHGVIDSLHLVQLIDGFQTDFGIEVTGESLTPENFGSIAGMARFLAVQRA